MFLYKLIEWCNGGFNGLITIKGLCEAHYHLKNQQHQQKNQLKWWNVYDPIHQNDGQQEHGMQPLLLGAASYLHTDFTPLFKPRNTNIPDTQLFL